jgi:ubiquinone/menaquinone biosynthesis C-methylase UbiE
LDLKPSDSLLDLGCGQGVLGRQVSPKIYYQGVDVASRLIAYAKEHDRAEEHHYLVADVTKPTLPFQRADFSHAAIVLAVQNMRKIDVVFDHLSARVITNGKAVIVLNHPCFRIPRQSSWQVDEVKKTQYRRIDRYFTPLEIPVLANPSLGEKSAKTWSFHHPLQDYFSQLKRVGFCVELVEEWTSDKLSQGKASKMENRGRSEFPLFLTIVARKITIA